MINKYQCMYTKYIEQKVIKISPSSEDGERAKVHYSSNVILT